VLGGAAAGRAATVVLVLRKMELKNTQFPPLVHAQCNGSSHVSTFRCQACARARESESPDSGSYMYFSRQCNTFET
jgi:hypothetical protein